MKKIMQLVTIGLAAYNLYTVVNDFLETDTGKKVKKKVKKKVTPYVKDAIKKGKEVVDEVKEATKTSLRGTD
jgi:nucleoid-associated protein YejK